MDSTRYIAGLNAQFVTKAADISRLSEIDETIEKMRADPKKKAAIHEMQDSLFDKVSIAFRDKVTELAQRNQKAPNETELKLLACDVLEVLVFENPKILRPLIERDINLHVGIILATESLPSHPNRGPK